MTDENDHGSMAEPVEAPALRVLTPDATPEQVAAVVAVFSAMGGEDEVPAPTSQWASPARRMRRPLHPGPGGWRASALPH